MRLLIYCPCSQDALSGSVSIRSLADAVTAEETFGTNLSFFHDNQLENEEDFVDNDEYFGYFREGARGTSETAGERTSVVGKGEATDEGIDGLSQYRKRQVSDQEGGMQDLARMPCVNEDRYGAGPDVMIAEQNMASPQERYPAFSRAEMGILREHSLPDEWRCDFSAPVGGLGDASPTDDDPYPFLQAQRDASGRSFQVDDSNIDYVALGLATRFAGDQDSEELPDAGQGGNP